MAVASIVRLFAWVMAFVLSISFSSAAVVQHSFFVGNLTVNRLCQQRVITAVNGSLPGPTIEVREGDTLVVRVVNQSPYNVTIHWHGIFQQLSGWMDGPEFVTQCPILPGRNFTYRFNITNQEGTLWWHSHVQWLRATVYGGLIIKPRRGRSYPFQTPDQEIPLIIGEWWNANVIDVENNAAAIGAAPNNSDAYTINGLPGPSFNCTQDGTYRVQLVTGRTYLLRIVNAALNNQHFFKIANHTFTVVAIDAIYTNPYQTDTIVLAPGQTVDALMTARQRSGAYNIAASPYVSAPGIGFNNATALAVAYYRGSANATPLVPLRPATNDTGIAHRFYTNLTSRVRSRTWVPVPTRVDHRMLVTIGLGLVQCAPNATCQGPLRQNFGASMNNQSFVLPSRGFMLDSFFNKRNDTYTLGFPDQPPTTFDYTNGTSNFDLNIAMTTRSTKVKQLKFNDTVEMVLQNTNIITVENHPMHLHGFNFHVLAQGFGNYNANRDSPRFNLNNSQIRNTIAVPTGGWAAIRFQANNPGIWLMHCHLDVHLPWGLGMAFEVQNGNTRDSTLPSPPADMPRC